jgi:hypothetical protein
MDSASKACLSLHSLGFMVLIRGHTVPVHQNVVYVKRYEDFTPVRVFLIEDTRVNLTLRETHIQNCRLKLPSF